MNSEHPIPPDADPASEPSAARPESCTCCGGARQPDPTDRYMAMLDRLAEIGMEMSEMMLVEAREEMAARRDARWRAAAGAEPPPGRQAERDRTELSFDRLTRALRLCLALSMRLHTDRLERERKIAAGPQPSGTSAEAKSPRSRRARQLERLVTEAIGKEAEPERRPELEERLRERLEEDDILRDIDRCSLGELIDRICRDLRIEPDWEAWEKDHWAREEARRKPPGSPYAEPIVRKSRGPELTRIEWVIVDPPKPDEVIDFDARIRDRERPPPGG